MIYTLMYIMYAGTQPPGKRPMAHSSTNLELSSALNAAIGSTT